MNSKSFLLVLEQTDVLIFWTSKHLEYYQTFSFYQTSQKCHLERSSTNQISWVSAVPWEEEIECSSLPLQAGTKSLWDTVITGLLFQTFKKEWTHVCPWKSLVPVKIPGRLWSWTASPNSFACYPAPTSYSRINSTAARISTGSYS